MTGALPSSWRRIINTTLFQKVHKTIDPDKSVMRPHYLYLSNIICLMTSSIYTDGAKLSFKFFLNDCRSCFKPNNHYPKIDSQDKNRRRSLLICLKLKHGQDPEEKGQLCLIIVISVKFLYDCIKRCIWLSPESFRWLVIDQWHIHMVKAPRCCSMRSEGWD